MQSNKLFNNNSNFICKYLVISIQHWQLAYVASVDAGWHVNKQPYVHDYEVSHRTQAVNYCYYWYNALWVTQLQLGLLVAPDNSASFAT